MKENTKNKWLHLRLSEAEYRQIRTAFARTTERKLSRYARKILLGKPMIASYRDTSLEDIIQVLIRLQNDLNGLANNYNQMVHKLHTLDRTPEFRAWCMTYDLEKEILFKHIGELKEYVHKTADKWLR